MVRLGKFRVNTLDDVYPSASESMTSTPARAYATHSGRQRYVLVATYGCYNATAAATWSINTGLTSAAAGLLMDGWNGWRMLGTSGGGVIFINASGWDGVLATHWMFAWGYS